MELYVREAQRVPAAAPRLQQNLVESGQVASACPSQYPVLP
jgi:hypothetical protein